MNNIVTGSRKLFLPNLGIFVSIFFELNNNDNAGAVYRNWYHQIKEATGGAVYSSTEDYYNYSGFYVYDDDMYYHLVWVDNTVVMAFGGKNYKNDIFKILEAIGY